MRATDNEKRIIIAEFVRDKTGIKTANVTINLLRNQLLEAVDEEYYIELYNDVFRYNCVSSATFLNHILKCYTELDNKTLHLKLKKQHFLQLQGSCPSASHFDGNGQSSRPHTSHHR